MHLTSQEEDPTLDADLAALARELTAQLDLEATRLTLNGPHDRAATILTVRAGAGGTERPRIGPKCC